MRHVDAEQGYQRRLLWEADSRPRWHKIGNEANLSVADRIAFQNAQSADFELAANCGGRGCTQQAVVLSQQNLIIGDQLRRRTPQCVRGESQTPQCEV